MRIFLCKEDKVRDTKKEVDVCNLKSKKNRIGETTQKSNNVEFIAASKKISRKILYKISF